MKFKMKLMLSLFSAAVIALTLVTSVKAATCSSNDNNCGVFSDRGTTMKATSAREADKASNLDERTSSAPAYTDYIDYRFVLSSANARDVRTPDQMSAW
jgi:hypothetical protein